MSTFNWKSAVCAVAMMSLSCPAVLAAEGTATAAEGATANDTMSLEDIQDVAVTLQRIHQQALDIFVESTRKKASHLDTKALALTTIPETNFEDQKSYLPLRKGWLAFFIGTIESLVSILNEQLNHLDEIAQRNAIPADKMPEWRALATEWKAAVHGLNDQLDVCAKVLDDPEAQNVQVAKSAQAIDQQVAVLQKLLVKADKLKQ